MEKGPSPLTVQNQPLLETHSQQEDSGCFPCFQGMRSCEKVGVKCKLPSKGLFRKPVFKKKLKSAYVVSPELKVSSKRSEVIPSKQSTASKELASWQEKVAKLSREMANRAGKPNVDSNRSIAEMTLHGTHDSGTYSIKFPRLSKVPGLKYIAKLAKNYSVTQTKTISEQLNSGVRYLDLRLRSSSTESGFRIHHGVVNGSDSTTGLGELFEYARQHPKEMVVVKMQFDHDKGDSLDTFYQSFLKNNEALLVKKTDDDGNPRSFADIKPGEGQGNIVLMTKDKKSHLSSKYDGCWDYKKSTFTKWANTAESSELKNTNKRLLSRKVEAREGKLLINQMQKTSLTTALKNRDAMKSLYEQAETVNSKIDDWLVEWARKDPSIKPNIISSDFFDAFEEGENMYISIAFNLLDVDDGLIKKEFPETADRIIKAKERIKGSETISPIPKAKGIAHRFKAMLQRR
ncbi:hypothetical protein [Endozoicomonas sp.]|uniref:hypothetical protein n=1 Tax=Endozoicomonas sp. TaxID=1892382 RepID=UPI003AF868C9